MWKRTPSRSLLLTLDEEGAVYSKIIVGYDGYEQSRDALALGRVLAETTGAELLAARVFRGDLPLALDAPEDGRVETRVIESSSPARGLHDLAESEEADVIVLGSSHRGHVGRVLMGSVSDRLFHDAPCAVAIAPRGFSDRTDAALRVIGVAFDGSSESKAALAEAARLGEAASATLRIFAVAESKMHTGHVPVPATYDHAQVLHLQKEYLEREIAYALEGLPRKLRALGAVLYGEPAELLVSKAEEGIDILVAGSRGYGPARRVLLGSVSSQLARSLPCALLVVPRLAERSGRSVPAAVTTNSAV